ncbi:Xaa-Pro peptidase family protein [Halovivax sp.]|uniref:M24 family metallopeptidase n=1 Tax=Halovivax sp. TaxID=1935978 RepID=UPI0025C314D1|nr:Xaa-Pro peptidase family protein [Halovivax sp.]
MTNSEYDLPHEERTRRCRRALADVDADCVVLSPGPNMTYLSGFTDEPMERHLLLFVPREGDPTFLAPTMYDEQIRAASWVDDRRLWDDGEDPQGHLEAIADALDLRGGRVLVDDRMWALFTQDLRRTLPDATFGLASEVTTELRIRKDGTELAAMRRAGEIADAVSADVRALGDEAIGMTEQELAREIESRLVAAGGEGPSFEVVVGSGPNGAMPHHRHGDREIGPGDPVVLDFGTRVAGYPSDQTRTVAFGDAEPPSEFEDVFEVVCEAQEAGIDAAEPGATAEAVDRAARAVIDDAGFGDAFVHRTGHGVGLEVHEPPYVVAGNDRELEPGMVFSVEPGIYLEGRFGVRIEDLVVVTASGCERLNRSPRHHRTG